MVADGYAYWDDLGGEYFHINCGWHGNNNGWYKLGGLPVESDPSIDVSFPYSVPDNYIYVDGQDHTPYESDGSIKTPYRYVASGVSNTPAGGKLLIKGGTYTGENNSPIVIDKPMTLQNYLGHVVLGD